MRTPRFHVLIWLLALIAFIVGTYVGMEVHAKAGAALWATSAILALAPFASHRNKPPPTGGPGSEPRRP